MYIDPLTIGVPSEYVGREGSVEEKDKNDDNDKDFKDKFDENDNDFSYNNDSKNDNYDNNDVTKNCDFNNSGDDGNGHIEFILKDLHESDKGVDANGCINHNECNSNIDDDNGCNNDNDNKCNSNIDDVYHGCDDNDHTEFIIKDVYESSRGIDVKGCNNYNDNNCDNDKDDNDNECNSNIDDVYHECDNDINGLNIYNSYAGKLINETIQHNVSRLSDLPSSLFNPDLCIQSNLDLNDVSTNDTDLRTNNTDVRTNNTDISTTNIDISTNKIYISSANDVELHCKPTDNTDINDKDISKIHTDNTDNTNDNNDNNNDNINDEHDENDTNDDVNNKSLSSSSKTIDFNDDSPSIHDESGNNTDNNSNQVNPDLYLMQEFIEKQQVSSHHHGRNNDNNNSDNKSDCNKNTTILGNKSDINKKKDINAIFNILGRKSSYPSTYEDNTSTCTDNNNENKEQPPRSYHHGMILFKERYAHSIRIMSLITTCVTPKVCICMYVFIYVHRIYFNLIVSIFRYLLYRIFAYEFVCISIWKSPCAIPAGLDFIVYTYFIM
jgi:hypothetical protein